MDSIATNYSSSECDSDSDEREDHFEPSLARLPAEIIEKYKLEPNTSKHEAMSLGFSRPTSQRWCTFLYYEWRPNRSERARLTKIVDRFNTACEKSDVAFVKPLHFEPLYLSSLGAPLSLHVSLSQSINFEKEAHRDLLFDKLRQRIQSSSRLSPFTMKFQSKLELMPSYGKETLFLTLPVDPVIKSKQMAAISKVIQEATAETFPSKTSQEIQDLTCMPVSTHMSIALATNVPRSILENMNFIPMLLPMSEDEIDFEFPVSSLKFDKNRQILNIPLDQTQGLPSQTA